MLSCIHVEKEVRTKKEGHLRSCWSSLGLAITDDDGSYEIRFIHDGTKRNTEGIAELAALVN